MALDPAGRYRITGVIDRLARATDGVYEVHDYKTSSSLPREEDLRRDRQLAFYQMSVSQRYPDAREIRLVWHFLVHGRRFESRRSEAEIAAQRQATRRLIDAIEAARDFPPRESALCRWCEYRDICPAQRHVVAAEREAEKHALREAAERRLNAPGRPSGRAEQMSLAPPAPAARPRPPDG
jgi:putative RecB family exonuclease